MCGIAGIVSSKKNNIDKKLVYRMTNSISHRGPDGHGYHFENKIGFGHRRLSIIDIEGGFQPMSDNDKNIWITYNGEIYNYKILRKKLISLGHSFQTSCDTEVLIYAYKQWGENALSYLDGMFAFALWDNRKNKLLLARDRRGVKPLYWTMQNDEILFASEIKAILKLPTFQKKSKF